jgi:tetratricopeptide (TPR) repeat protein
MKNQKILLLSLSLLLSQAALVPGQAKELNWEKHNKAGVKNIEKNDYEGAEKNLKKAVATAHQFREPGMKMGTSLGHLGLAYMAQGKYPQAEKALSHAIEIKMRSMGATNEELVPDLNNLAKVYIAMGRYASAEPLLQQVLQIKQKTVGADHPSLEPTLRELGTVYSVNGQFAEAEGYFKRAEVIIEKSPGLQHNLVPVLNDMASMYKSKGNLPEAEAHYKRILELDEKSLSPKDPTLASDLNNLASVMMSLSNYAGAEPLLKRAVDIQKSNRKSPKELPIVMESYANCLRKLYKNAEADKVEAQIHAMAKKNH